MTFFRIRSVFVAGLLLAGCHYTIEAPSTEPSPTLFAFPAGLAMDPDGRYLYVSNGNADLRYGGGTLMMVDTERFECALKAKRILDAAFGAEPKVPHDAAKTIAAKLDATCTADFGAAKLAEDINVTRDAANMPTYGCVYDPLDPQSIDCKESPFVLGNSTVRVGNFAGTMRIARTGGATSKTRTLYLAVRGDPSITWVDVKVPDSGLAAVQQPGLMNCFDDPNSELVRDGYDAATNTTVIPPTCDASHLIQTYQCEGRYHCEHEADDEKSTIPAEPFNILLDNGTHGDGSTYSRLLVSHLAAGQVMLIDLPDRMLSPTARPVIADVSPPFFAADSLGRHGVFGLARYGADDGALYYLTTNLSASIATFRLANSVSGGTVVPSATFSIAGGFPSSADGRELIFSPDQQRAFLAQNSPPSLSVIDTRLDQPAGRGLPTNKLLDSVPVCQAASHMAIRQAREQGPVGTGSFLKTRLYLACFISNQIMVVDPDRPGVDETILLGRGPTEIAFNFTGEETPVAEQLVPKGPRRAYVTFYGESTIGVIDLEPGSPTENRLIARIGLPLPIDPNHPR